MFDESSLITKLMLTLFMSVYVVCFATIFYPVAIYNMLVEMVEHVWGLEPNQLSSYSK